MQNSLIENSSLNTNSEIAKAFEEAAQNKEAFWAKQAGSLDWFSSWNKVLDWNPPHARWFVGAKMNAAYNCLDRHVKRGLGSKTAIYWEGELGEEKVFTYEDLLKEVSKLSNVLKDLGVKKGDKVAIYLPLVPESVIAMLSCARIGAVHTVIFAGFSHQALKDRIDDAEAKVLITADGGFRKGNTIPLKDVADKAIENSDSIERVLVLRHSNQSISMKSQRDFWYHQMMEGALPICAPEEMDAEDELFILYTSGSTGKPKGIVHTTGGYKVGTTMTTKWVFDPNPLDVYWCTADVGWITGHSYVAYGPLSNGMTQVIYEGAPDYPEKNRFWKLIEKYKVTILYTAPTAIRTFMKWGNEWLEGFDLTSLRLLGSVGEPIGAETWSWYHKHIGQERCPIVDTWWQTETGGIMIAPIPGMGPVKPGSASKPLPGIDVAIVNSNLVITSPWPSMLRGIHKDPVRFEETYWKNKDFYFTGDGAKHDEDGDIWITGRVDDVINVSGHRLGTMEIESCLVGHDLVVESAVIGTCHEIKGQCITAFVTLKDNVNLELDLEKDLKSHVAKEIGAIARPERVLFIQSLPKTRSGKIMRRLLRDIAEGRSVGDVSTLADPAVIEQLKNQYLED
jgi:acetyl-CoA synthetase